MKVRYRVTQDVRDVEDGIARMLIARNLAEAVTHVPIESPAPKARAIKPAKSRRGRYQRRDLRAASQ